MTKPRFEPGADILRHLFAVAVIVQHMASSRYSPSTNAWLHGLLPWIDGAVAGFFLFAGFFLKTGASFWSFAKGRATRLLLPFLLFSCLYAIVMAGLGKMSLMEGLLRTIMLRGASMQLYFLPYLFLLCLAVWPLQKWGSSWSWGCAVLALSGLAIVLPTVNCTGSELRLLPYYGLALVVGCLLSLWEEKGRLLPYGLLTAVSIGVVGMWDSRFLTLAALTLVATLALGRVGALLPQRRFPGSGAVYLLHTPVLNYVISVVLMKFGIVETMNVLLSVCATYIVCLLTASVVIKYQNRFRWLLLE